jgi:predicted DNA-binding ribbon-helix-helix protein
MCRIFVDANPASYEMCPRSLRLHGVVTSLRLEELFWDVLGEIGERDGMTVNQLITTLYDEIIAARGDIPNFASFLRVCCLRYLSLQITGGIPDDVSVSIRSLDACSVLTRERRPFKPMVTEAD